MDAVAGQVPSLASTSAAAVAERVALLHERLAGLVVQGDLLYVQFVRQLISEALHGPAVRVAGGLHSQLRERLADLDLY